MTRPQRGLLESWTSPNPLRYVGSVARTWADEAIAALAPLPEGVVKTSLSNFALAVVDRAS